MPRGTRFAALASGTGFTVALDQHGDMWGWGDDGTGQLGDGRQVSAVYAPVRATMPRGIRFTALAAGAWAWGNNDIGNLGTGDTTSLAISAGAFFTLALDSTVRGGGGGPGSRSERETWGLRLRRR